MMSAAEGPKGIKWLKLLLGKIKDAVTYNSRKTGTASPGHLEIWKMLVVTRLGEGSALVFSVWVPGILNLLQYTEKSYKKKKRIVLPESQ